MVSLTRVRVVVDHTIFTYAQVLVYTVKGLTENDGHENDGPSKLQDMKLQDVKMQDMKLQDMKLEDKQRKSSNRDYIRMQFLLLFSKHATVK